MSESGTCWGPAQAPVGGGRIRDGERFDVVVVGAGLAGCSTALHLALERPDVRVAVLEADTVAAGASGRGTGLLGPRLGPPVDVARRRDGDRVARARYLRSEAAVRRVLELGARYAPAAISPCAGQLVVGFTAAEQLTVRRRAAAYARLGLPVKLVAAGEQSGPARPETPALHYPTAAGVDPSALTRGLARAAADAGVTLVEECPVVGLKSGADRTGVVTPAGVVLARAVVVTVDVTAPGLGVRFGDQLALQVCASATAPLSADLLAALGGPSGCHVLCAAPLGGYRRITPDGRLVLGGGPATPVAGRSADALTRSARSAWIWQQTWLRSVHPDLADVELAHRWRGRIGLTRDGLPVLERAPGPAELWYAGGWNGHGLAATVEAGALLAERVLSGSPSTGSGHESTGSGRESTGSGRESTGSGRRTVDGFGTGSRWWLARPVATPVVRAYVATQVPKVRRGKAVASRVLHA